MELSGEYFFFGLYGQYSQRISSLVSRRLVSLRAGRDVSGHVQWQNNASQKRLFHCPFFASSNSETDLTAISFANKAHHLLCQNSHDRLSLFTYLSKAK